MDRAVLEQLAACHEAGFAWALGCCGHDRQSAEDVLQDAYLKVLDGRARWDGRSAFKTWLFAVIRRTAADHRRRAIFRLLRLVPLEESAPAQTPLPDADAESSDQRERLIGALRRLSARQREVLLLVFYHEHTVEQAAEVMGISVGSARTHYARGKERLRELLT